MSEKRFDFNYQDGAAATAQAASTNNPGGTGSSQQTNGNWSYAAASKLEGPTGLKVSVASATNTVSRFAPTAANTLMSLGLAFRLEQLPPQNFHNFASLRNSGGPAVRAFWNRNNQMGLRGIGATTAEVFGDKSLTINKQYWMTLVANASTGAVTAKFYDTVTRELSCTIQSTSAISIGTTAFNAGDIGWGNGDPVSGNVAHYDSLVFNDGLGTEIMPPSWQALVGQMWDGSAIQNGTLRSWDGSALSELSAVTIS